MENLSSEMLEIISKYSGVIDVFKKTSEVNRGDIGFKRDGVNVADADRPASAGYGFGMTGYCVSASRALLEFGPFNTLLSYRNAQAKLISIDIKEQYYGVCYNNSQNYWHTAILVSDWIGDIRYNFVIDITVRQFGDEFVDKDFWSFETWMNKLRSATCTHQLTDFDGKVYSIVPKNELVGNKSFREYNQIELLQTVDSLKRNIMIKGADRNMIVDFIFNKIPTLNERLLTGNIKTDDITYIQEINQIINKLYFSINTKTVYSLLKFETKGAMANWCKMLSNTMTCPQYLLTFDSVVDACKYYDINEESLNCVSSNENDVHYLYVEFEPGSIFQPTMESQLIKGFVLHQSFMNITFMNNTGVDTGQMDNVRKVFNTYRITISPENHG